MDSNISEVVASIKKAVQENINKNLIAGGKVIADELTATAKQAIDTFYGYTPIKYNRSGGMNDTYKRFYKNNGHIIRAGVELIPPSTSYLNYNKKKSVSGEYVFDLTYSGHHGNTELFPFPVSHFPPVMNPSPMELILNKREQIKNNIYAYFS